VSLKQIFPKFVTVFFVVNFNRFHWKIFILKFPWNDYLVQSLFGKFSLSKNEAIVVDNWDYIVKAVDIFSSYGESDKKGTLINLLLFDFFDSFSASLPTKYLEAGIEVTKVITLVYILFLNTLF
jgi:hypothetical protein